MTHRSHLGLCFAVSHIFKCRTLPAVFYAVSSSFWYTASVQANRTIASINQFGIRSINHLPSHLNQVQGCASIRMESKDVQEITEGKANILLPKSVFYNPVQEFNRDLTTCVISQFAEDFLAESPELCSESDKKRKKKQAKKADDKSATEASNSETVKDSENISAERKGIRIFEGLSASGLRSIRFGLEVPHVKEIIANDFDQGAVKFIEKNIEKNNLVGLVKSSYGDASMVMYQNKDYDKRFDAIDLDPYGSAAQFLDAAVQAVSDGGLLCITCTDAAVLCGKSWETCFAKYGSVSLRAKYCHEMALRILLHCVQAQANRYSRYIVPLISLSIDFYVRIFVRVYTSQKQVKMSVTQNSMVYHCVGCGSFTLQQVGSAKPTKGDCHQFIASSGPPVGPACEHCGHRHHEGGPFWSAPLHDAAFLDKMLARVERDQDKFKTSGRMKGMLSVVREELQDVPFYYVLDNLCNILHCTPPNMVQMRSALINAGYRVSLSHAAKNSYKTDAPPAVIWDILRAWVKDHPVNPKRLTEGSVAKAILSKEPSREISFTLHADANPASRQTGLVRWQINPTPEWGPKARARRSEGKEKSTGSDKPAGDSAKEEESANGSEAADDDGTGDNGKLDDAFAGVKRPHSQDLEADVSKCAKLGAGSG